MPEKIVDLVDMIRSVKGQEYANGMVDLANLLVNDAEEKGDNNSDDLSKS